MGEDFTVEEAFIMKPEDIHLHSEKMAEHTKAMRPEIAAGDKNRFYSLKLKNRSGEVIAGSYGYTFMGILFCECLWVDANKRGQKVGEQILKEVIALGKRRGCEQMLGYNIDFFGSYEFLKKLGGKTLATIKSTERNFTLYYMRLSLIE